MPELIPLVGGTRTYALDPRERLPLPRGDFPEVIDSTMLATFSACPEKFHLAYCLNRASPGKSVHLHAGAAFATGLEAARRAFFEQGLDSSSAIEQGIIALWRAYGLEFEDSTKNGTQMARALVQYCDYWPFHLLPPLDLSGSPAIEFSFALPIPINHPVTGNPLLLAGRFDMIGVSPDGGMFCVDEKTTSASFSSTTSMRNWTRQFDLRGQFLCYNWAARAYGHPTIGTIVRGVSIQKSEIAFAEAITYFAEWEIARWYDQTMRCVERMCDCWRTGTWELSLGSACTQYNGCEFNRVCKTAYPARELESFVEKKWNPLERNEK